jgi:hypothetical protein
MRRNRPDLCKPARVFRRQLVKSAVHIQEIALGANFAANPFGTKRSGKVEIPVPRQPPAFALIIHVKDGSVVGLDDSLWNGHIRSHPCRSRVILDRLELQLPIQIVAAQLAVFVARQKPQRTGRTTPHVQQPTACFGICCPADTGKNRVCPASPLVLGSIMKKCRCPGHIAFGAEPHPRPGFFWRKIHPNTSARRHCDPAQNRPTAVTRSVHFDPHRDLLRALVGQEHGAFVEP